MRDDTRFPSPADATRMAAGQDQSRCDGIQTSGRTPGRLHEALKACGQTAQGVDVATHG